MSSNARALSSEPRNHRNAYQVLLSHHEDAEEKCAPGFKALWVKRNIYGDPGFFIERTDGTFMDFSYKRCLSPRSQRTRVMAALRRAITDQVFAARDMAFAESDVFGRIPCALSGELITVDMAHVDHAYPVTFSALVEQFLSERSELVEDVPIASHPSGQGVVISSQPYIAAWQDWHAQHAVLRIVKAEINIARGARA